MEVIIAGGVSGEDAHLGHIDDDVAGGVDDQHEVVPPSKVVSPGGPVKNFPILKHLKIEVVITVVKIFFSMLKMT